MSMVAVGIGSTALSAGMGIYGMIDGKNQAKKAQSEMDKLNKPSYTIPQEILDNLSDAEKRTVEGLPAEQKQEYVKNLERSQQNYLKGAKDRKSGLAGLQDSTNRANDQYTNLVSMDAATRAQNKKAKEQEISMARSAVANAKNQQFAFNMEDYQAQLQSSQANYQAGKQNQMSGMMQVGSSLIGLAGSGALKGGGGKTTTNPSYSDASAASNSISQLPMNTFYGAGK